MKSYEMNIKRNNKLIFINNLNYLIGEMNYRNGYPFFNEDYRKRRILLKPLIGNTLMAIIIIRDIISFFISDDFYSLLIGDYLFKFQFKLQWNLFLIVMYIMVVLIQIVCHSVIKTNHKFNQVLKTSFNENLHGANQLRTRLDIIQGMNMATIQLTGFVFSFVFLSKDSSFVQLMTLGLFWSLFYSEFCAIMATMYISNLVYILYFCYYSRYLLNLENKRIKSLLISKKLITNSAVISVLRNIDIIYRKIMTFNEIWSPILMINWVCLAIMIAILSITILVVDSVIIRVSLLITLVFILNYIINIVIFCSCLELEAKQTYKLLTQINAKINSRLSLNIRIKVRKIISFKCF